MERVLDEFKKISSNIDNIEEYEDFESYTLSFEVIGIINPLKWSDLTFILTFINSRDTVLSNVFVNDGEPYSFKVNMDSQEYESNLEDLNQIIEKDSTVKIKYIISKNKFSSTISIYNLELVYWFLNKLKLEQLLNQLQKNLDFSTLNIFEKQNDIEKQIYFRSSLLIITSVDDANILDFSQEEYRKSILKKRKFNTNPQKFSDYKFIPSDFHNLDKDKSDHYLNRLFNRLNIILSASFISNTSDILKKDTVQIGIIGHKYIDISLDFQNFLGLDAQIFYPIYQWVYEQGDTHDKLDLSRNIISRYITQSKNSYEMELSSDTLSSIQSAHAIYLKENVEKYLETKNKVAEITTELSIKSKDISQYFISSFKNNNLTIITYFISIFIFNSLAFNSIQKIFSIEKYYLSMVFLLISALHLIITRVQIYKDIKFNIRYYYSMKRIYKDIFEPHELNGLFHKKQLKYNIGNIKETMNLFSWIWIIEIILLLIISIYLTFYI